MAFTLKITCPFFVIELGKRGVSETYDAWVPRGRCRFPYHPKWFQAHWSEVPVSTPFATSPNDLSQKGWGNVRFDGWSDINWCIPCHIKTKGFVGTVTLLGGFMSLWPLSHLWELNVLGCSCINCQQTWHVVVTVLVVIVVVVVVVFDVFVVAVFAAVVVVFVIGIIVYSCCYCYVHIVRISFCFLKEYEAE